MFKFKKELNLVSQNLFIYLATILEFIASTIVAYFVSFTFGASLFEEFNETLIFSILMSSICVMPILLYIEHENPLELLNRLLIQREFYNKIEKLLANISYGGVFGAWFGALVIPLDWDRWWQIWPISCCFGALIGSSSAFLFTLIYMYNKKKLHS
jgi:phosphatidylinositol glycan class F